MLEPFQVGIPRAEHPSSRAWELPAVPSPSGTSRLDFHGAHGIGAHPPGGHHREGFPQSSVFQQLINPVALSKAKPGLAEALSS